MSNHGGSFVRALAECFIHNFFKQIQMEINYEQLYEFLLEYCANLEHQRWAKWQNFVHQTSKTNEDHSKTIPAELVQKWNLQINTEYADLLESEKESDRKEVRPYLDKIFNLLVTKK